MLVPIVLAGAMPSASAQIADYESATPVFGLAERDGVVYVADSGAGVVRLDETTGSLLVELPGVTDVAPRREGRLWALTSARRNKKLYRVVDGNAHAIADLAEFERRVNPHPDSVESNPFDLAKRNRRVLVADAAGNSLLIVNRRGRIAWVATLPNELVSTQDLKDLVGCPDAEPELADLCDLPAEMEAQAVATSVAVGPDGAFYVTELKGFPAPTGESRIWRIEPGTRHAVCDAEATEGPCTVVADGFTSIVDLTFGADGTAYVVELDEASWFAVELGESAMLGGTINECDTNWTCTERATGLTMPMAVAVSGADVLYAVVNALIPGAAEVIEVP